MGGRFVMGKHSAMEVCAMFVTLTGPCSVLERTTEEYMNGL